MSVAPMRRQSESNLKTKEGNMLTVTAKAARRRLVQLALMALAVAVFAAVAAASASATMSIDSFSGGNFDANGASEAQAGAHPFKASATFVFKMREDGSTAEDMKNATVELPRGFIGNPEAVPKCSQELSPNVFGQIVIPYCPPSSQVGVANIRIAKGKWFPADNSGFGFNFPIYNMEPPRGTPARFRFAVMFPDIAIDGTIRQSDYGVNLSVTNTSQALDITGVKVTYWGVPADPAHDIERYGSECNNSLLSPVPCTAGVPSTPFISNPTDCSAGPLTTTLRVDSWQDPGNFATSSFNVDENGLPTAVEGCDRLDFRPKMTVAPTSKEAEAPTGLDVDLELPQNENPEGLATANLKKAVVTLPEGVSVNPSAGEGLEACAQDQYQSATADSAGCPDGSKIGSVRIDTPLLHDPLEGDLFIAKQYDNPFNTLLAMYIIARSPERGVLIKAAGKVVPDPRTGQLTTTFDDLPQLPFDHFGLSFREGQRSPLSTPAACGAYTTEAEFVPWSAADPDHPAPSEVVHSDSSFTISHGVNGGPCPSGDTPPFHPGLAAGTINNAAGHYSPFDVRLTRNDGEQEFTNFSIKLPPGVTGKLAGIPFCSDAAIEAAKSRTGTAEIESPSCPAASEVGRTLVGVGVGGVLTYAPGKVYLAGPYHGSALSIAAITAAKVGPFDVGTVVVREALKVNPETAEVFVDATGSDPIPHIIAGIPVHARDIRVYVDKPDFVLNPTSCARTSTASTVLGSGADFASDLDNQPVTITSPFQAADCASLPYKPRLALKLRGATKRGGNPALTAILRPRPGEANSKRVSVALPHSEFLDQSHIKTICTRVQFKAGDGNGSACPKGSIYGHVKAWTPLLSDPLVGEVYLRSSEHPLPDLVLALHGLVDFTAVGRIDSVKGGIRNTFEAVPDAPIEKVEVRFAGAKKGLLVNSTDICRGRHRAALEYTAHSGKAYAAKAPLKARGCGKAKRKRSRGHR